MKLKKLAALLLALTMIFVLAACGRPAADSSEVPSAAPTEPAQETAEPSDAPAETPSEEPSAAPTEDVHVERPVPRLAVLSGPTGIGAAKLLSVPEENAQGYEYTIEADNSALVAGLSNGTMDIATMASNAAVNLYNKTDGGVKIIALGTLGVLHILESGGNTAINSIADLAGKTIWSAGQGANPEYILRHLLEKSGVADQVTVQFADASEIQARLLSGEIECAMLPVPAATAAIAKSEGSVRDAVDVTEAWNEAEEAGQLVMTAVVVRTEFLETYPDVVNDFLKDYEASINYVVNNVEDAAQMVADLGITPSAGIAKAAIPQCHLTFIAGADMQSAVSDYFRVLWKLDPASIGGFIPDDGIYYVG